MKHLAALLFVALLTTVVLLFFTNPELLQDVWLWIIGFIGHILLLLEKGFQSVAQVVRGGPRQGSLALLPTDTSTPAAIPSVAQAPVVPDTALLRQRIAELEQKLSALPPSGNRLSDQHLTVLRYLDDGQTTLGMLFVHKKFFAYILEDTYHEVKVPGATRIPAGVYRLDFHREMTPKTQQYREEFPWFDFHLEIKEVPGFRNIYLHVGNTHIDTEGCLLIADGVNTNSTVKMIQYSRLAYERFYKTMSALLRSDAEVHIQIVDETWFERAQLTTT